MGGEVDALLRRAIAESGLSQNELAKRSGVSQAAISRFLAGVCSMKIENVDALLNFLKIDVEGKKRLGRKRAGGTHQGNNL